MDFVSHQRGVVTESIYPEAVAMVGLVCVLELSDLYLEILPHTYKLVGQVASCVCVSCDLWCVRYG